ncbi:MAG: hypothetical protein NXI29_27925 [bacterium]|jgi:hypothetical protein|nr:hypothetical protein [bacterium]
MLKLLFCGKETGHISDIGQDGPEMWATFEPNNNATPLLPMWQFITDEKNFDIDPPFPPEFLDDGSWMIEDEEGERRPIFLPAVYDDGTISWRWRD